MSHLRGLADDLLLPVVLPPRPLSVLRGLGAGDRGREVQPGGHGFGPGRLLMVPREDRGRAAPVLHLVVLLPLHPCDADEGRARVPTARGSFPLPVLLLRMRGRRIRVRRAVGAARLSQATDDPTGLTICSSVRL